MKFISVLLHGLKVFILFTGCTILFYYGIMLINEEYQNYNRYDEPKGEAMKVTAAGQTEEQGLVDRLILFYLNGE
ncbi:YqzK family protein [Bacillus massilinigeriensis]|uniref:YqzK family protein n=1 Tax=Bacillus mediterraneensis TaxID=1805474 RepID=UPI0008F94ECD|nr:YqzK family protein [Bacillus mediterraneensis]